MPGVWGFPPGAVPTADPLAALEYERHDSTARTVENFAAPQWTANAWFLERR